MKQKVVGYIRVSTSKQDVERQRDEINKYANENGFKVVKFFEDKHTGIDYKERRGFQELLKYLQDNPKIKVVIFDEISRMGRDSAEQIISYKNFTKAGIKIYTRGKGEFGKNKEDKLLFTILSVISEYERQIIIERTSSGRMQVVKGGATQLGAKPYGYKLIYAQKRKGSYLNRQFVEINKDEAKVVGKIFELIDSGNTIFSIIRYLKENKICSPRGNRLWGQATISKLLRNTMYYGEWQFGKYSQDNTKYSIGLRDGPIC